MKYLADLGTTSYTIDIDHPGEVVVDGVPHVVSLETVNRGTTFSILIDDKSYEAYVERRDGVYYVEIGSERHAIAVEEWTRLCAKSSHGDWRLTRLRSIPMSRRSFRRWNA